MYVNLQNAPSDDFIIRFYKSLSELYNLLMLFESSFHLSFEQSSHISILKFYFVIIEL